MEKEMSKHLTSSIDQAARLLRDDELDVVAGGTPGFPGLPLGTNINISPWSNGSFDLLWDLVGATGHLPR
jgi:hypothetical protein